MRVSEQIEVLEARGLVIGLPLNLDGSEGDAAATRARSPRNFACHSICPFTFRTNV